MVREKDKDGEREIEKDGWREKGRGRQRERDSEKKEADIEHPSSIRRKKTILRNKNTVQRNTVDFFFLTPHQHRRKIQVQGGGEEAIQSEARRA